MNAPRPCNLGRTLLSAILAPAIAAILITQAPAQTAPAETPAVDTGQDAAASLPAASETTQVLDRWERWARRPSSPWILFGMAFAESSFFPIPPDALLIPMAALNPSRSFFYAAITSVASVLGGMFGYLIGYWLYQSIGVRIIRFYKLEKGFNKVSAAYRRYAGWAVGTAGFTPLPYKLFTIAAGAVRPPVKFTVFVVASALSRSARFFLVASVIFLFGDTIKNFILGHLGLLSIAFVVLLVLGFIVIKKLLHHAEKSHGETTDTES